MWFIASDEFENKERQNTNNNLKTAVFDIVLKYQAFKKEMTIEFDFIVVVKIGIKMMFSKGPHVRDGLLKKWRSQIIIWFVTISYKISSKGITRLCGVSFVCRNITRLCGCSFVNWDFICFVRAPFCTFHVTTFNFATFRSRNFPFRSREFSIVVRKVLGFCCCKKS